MNIPKYDVIIIGGGFYGCSLALFLKDYMDDILIIESEPTIMQRASYNNQARVHSGYHYPRSFMTAMRSVVNFSRFVEEFKDCIQDTFEKYYAIAKSYSKVTAEQFKIYCKRIEAPIMPAPKNVKSLFNLAMIDDVFLVKEVAFDSLKLRDQISTKLNQAGISVKTDSEAIKVLSAQGSQIEVQYLTKDQQTYSVSANHVYNCTYSQINKLLINSHLPTLPLKYELTEIALIQVPEHLSNLGITVMCGPFFSFIPFPPRGLHSLSHVRYTPHYYWEEKEVHTYMAAREYIKELPRKSNYAVMLQDAKRFIPSLTDSKYIDSIWEIKTLLPQNEIDDGRPILFKENHGIPNFTCVMGGKIDNIYDVFHELNFNRKKRNLNQ